MHMLLCYLIIRYGLCREAPERRKFSLFFINTAEFLPYSRYRLFLLNVLEAVQHNSNQNDDAGEHELQVRINTQSGQRVSQRGEDEHTDNHAGNLADTA